MTQDTLRLIEQLMRARVEREALVKALEQIVAYADGSTDPGIVSVARTALALVSDEQRPGQD